MDSIQAIILAVIEGVTEFLPVSSTGHMALASAFMGINKASFTKLFEIVIQFGAILSVVFLYWRKFLDFRRPSFYLKLAVAIVPALAFGALFKSHIESVLGKPLVIATILLLGGIVLLFVDRWFDSPGIEREEDITYRQAFAIGMFQVLSILLPGLSRSAATIIGGMQQKLSRPLAAEFSFFLAVPTMMAATVKSLYDVYRESPEVLDSKNVGTLLMGSLIAFLVAVLAIRLFITFVQKNGFRVFGWYRIAVGGLLIALILAGKMPS
jgi:undecaprenyl-diphosphatase